MPELERLDQIPGVGPRLVQKLITVFGSEDAAINVISNAQVASLAGIPGVGKKKALDIVQEAYALREGISAFEVLKTEDIQEIYTRILTIIQSYANSLFAKDKLSHSWKMVQRYCCSQSRTFMPSCSFSTPATAIFSPPLSPSTILIPSDPVTEPTLTSRW